MQIAGLGTVIWHAHNRLAVSLTTLAIAASSIFLQSGSAQAAKVIASQHYQKFVILNCPNVLCQANLPVVAAKRRIRVSRMSCLLNGPTNLQFQAGQLLVKNASDVTEARQFLTPSYRNSQGGHMFNQEMDVVITEGKYVNLAFNSAVAIPYYVDCTLFGVFERLE